MGNVHRLKTLDFLFDAIADGRKTFEVRKNDRAFQTGDILELVKYHGHPTDSRPPRMARPEEVIRKRITFLLQGGQFGIDPQYCVLGLGDDPYILLSVTLRGYDDND